MTQQNDMELEQQDDSAAAPVSGEPERRISVIESLGHGIKVRDGDSFDPHRFQEFDFTPAFRDKIMRAPLPLLDLRELVVSEPAHDTGRHASANDVTQPAGGSPHFGGKQGNANELAPSEGEVAKRPTYAVPTGADASSDTTSGEPANATQLLLPQRKARKSSGGRPRGKLAHKWKLLLFGGSLVLATFLALTQSQGPAMASTSDSGQPTRTRALAQLPLWQDTVVTSTAELANSITQSDRQSLRLARLSSALHSTKASNKSAPKKLWLPAE